MIYNYIVRIYPFKQNFLPYLELMFERMVDYTEPICQAIITSPQKQMSSWPALQASLQSLLQAE